MLSPVLSDTGYKLDETPTGDHVYKYIDTISRHVRSRIPGKPAPSLSYIQVILSYIVTILQFCYTDFKHDNNYNKRSVLRIRVNLDQLVKIGKLVRGC
jgi:hypothetical protein